MSFKVEFSNADGVQVVGLAGRLASATIPQFEATVAPLFGEPGQRVLFDLAGVSFVSSAGLRVILMAAKRASASGGKLVLYGMQPSVHDLFDMSGLFSILEATPDRAGALAAVRR